MQINKFGAEFNSSNITIISGKSKIVIGILYDLCAESIIYLNKDVLFIDGFNSFNPYNITILAKKLGINQKILLSRIHIARAFTEYQMETIVDRLKYAIRSYNVGIIAISYMAYLFEDERLFDILLGRIKSVTISSDIITVITTSNGFIMNNLLIEHGDKILEIED